MVPGSGRPGNPASDIGEAANVPVAPDAGFLSCLGDLVGLGISHPGTTFDKGRVIPVVNDEDRVTDLVHAFF